MTDARTGVAPGNCPKCEYFMDAATAANGTVGDQVRPSVGDLTVCFNCGTALVFDTTLTPVALTEEVRWGLDAETLIDLERAERQVKKFNLTRRRHMARLPWKALARKLRSQVAALRARDLS